VSRTGTGATSCDGERESETGLVGVVGGAASSIVGATRLNRFMTSARCSVAYVCACQRGTYPISTMAVPSL
jgi:hypothetical protein